MLTGRDLELIHLLEEFKIASSKQIHRLIFNNVSERYARQRLKTLTEKGFLKRERNHIDQDYIYYLKSMPGQVRHRLYLLDFYLALPEKYKLIDFEIEYSCGSMRADAYAEVQNGNYIYGFFVEVHLSGNFNQEKYERLYESGIWKNEGFVNFPKVVIITDRPIELIKSPIKYKILFPNLLQSKDIFT